MSERYKVAGYVKLAKLWERSKDTAIPYHHQYYKMKFEDSPDFELVDVYIDITGRKEIRHRPEMLRLLHDCREGRINCIAVQTRAYLAANTVEFCSLLRYLFDMATPIQIITEDEQYNINTILNDDHQKEELYRMARRFTEINPDEYRKWLEGIFLGIDKYVLQECVDHGKR